MNEVQINRPSGWQDTSAEVDSTWAESTEDRYMYALEVLPPIMFPGGFAVSEPVRHTSEGRPVYECWRRKGGKFFFMQGTIRAARLSLR